MSILPILISAVAAAIELVVGLLCLAFAAAPGWSALRWFAAIALSAAAFSFSNLAFVLPVSDVTVAWAGRLNWLFASVHVASWLAYSRAQVGEPIRRSDRVLGGGLVAMGLVALIPNASVLDPPLSVIRMEGLGLAYRVPDTTLLGDLVLPVLLVALAITMSRYVRYARAGVEGARAHLVAFAVFYAAAGTEVAVTLRLVALPYVVDVGFVAIVLAVSGEMARRVTRSARRLTSLTENLEVEVQQRTRELVAARDALVESERHAALGRLAAGVGHEINNPLAYVMANLGSLRETPLTAEQRQILDETLEGAERVARVTRELQLFARGTGDELQPVNVSDVVDSALRLVMHDLRHRARIDRDYHTNLSVLADPFKLGQVFLNLFVNASQALQGRDGTDVVTVRTYPRDERVVIEVADTGPGIDPDLLPRLFEPYLTTKPFPDGTGLGLSIVRSLVESMGGTVQAASALGRGAAFRVTLPACHAEAPGAPATESHAPIDEPPASSRVRVLVVDDEPMVARALRRALRGWEVDVANGGRQALRMIRRGDSYDAVVCDLMMPAMSGMDLHEELAQTEPDMARRVIFVTGGAVTERARLFLERADIRWLSKPVDVTELRRAITELAADRGMGRGGDDGHRACA